MNKKSSYKRTRPAPRRFPGLWLVVGAAVLLIAGGLAAWLSASPTARPAVTPQVSGIPRLAVDRTTIDEGYVKFNTPVHDTFRLSNIGSQPLHILGQPQVELVEGC